jgi:hypothetical protein
MKRIPWASAAVMAVTVMAAVRPAHGQNTTELALGFVDYDLRDQVLNPLAHRGRLASLGILWEGSDARVTRRFDAEVSAVPLHSRFESGWASLATDLRLAYRHAVEVAEPVPELSLRVGGALDATWHLSYFNDWDDSHFYWLTAYSAGIDVVVEHARADGARLSLEARAPVLTLASRPEAPIDYKVVNLDAGWILGKIHEGMSLRSQADHYAADVALRYRRPEGRLGRSFYWQLMYVRSDVDGSAALDLLRHTLGVTVGL